MNNVRRMKSQTVGCKGWLKALMISLLFIVVSNRYAIMPGFGTC